MKQSPEMIKIQNNMRPGVISLEGFLGTDKRNLADITQLIGTVYLGGEPPVAMQAGDCMIDYKLNLADITTLISFVYLGGADPDLQ